MNKQLAIAIHLACLAASTTTLSTTARAAEAAVVTGTVNLFDVDQHAIAEPDFDLNTNVSDGEVMSYEAAVSTHSSRAPSPANECERPVP